MLCRFPQATFLMRYLLAQACAGCGQEARVRTILCFAENEPSHILEKSVWSTLSRKCPFHRITNPLSILF